MDKFPFSVNEFKDLYHHMYGVFLGDQEITEVIKFISKHDIDKILCDEFTKFTTEFFPDDQSLVDYEDDYFTINDEDDLDYYPQFENEEKRYLLNINNKLSDKTSSSQQQDDGKTDEQKAREGVIRRRGRPTKKTHEEVIVYGAAGLVTGFVQTYIGDVIDNWFAGESDPLVTNLFIESYIAGMITSAVITVFNDMDPFALAVLAAGIFRIINRTLKEIVGRPFLEGEAFAFEFVYNSIFVFILLRLYIFYKEFFKYRYFRRHPHKKPKPKPKLTRPSFTKRVTDNLTDQFFITVFLAFRQSQINRARREAGEINPTPQNPNPQGNQQQKTNQ